MNKVCENNNNILRLKDIAKVKLGTSNENVAPVTIKDGFSLIEIFPY